MRHFDSVLKIKHSDNACKAEESSLAVGLLIIPRLSGGIDLPFAFVSCAAAFALFLLCVRFFPPISGIASSYRIFSDYSIVCGCDVSLMFLYAAYMLRIIVGAGYSFIRSARSGFACDALLMSCSD